MCANHSIRIYPHLQDTGGFFVAVLQKIPEPAESVSQGKRHAQSPDDLEATNTKKMKLSDDSQGSPPMDEDEKEDGDSSMAVLEPELNSPLVPSARVPSTAAASCTSKFKGDTKGKATQGADVHFKENPYTYISPEDPAVQTCMLVYQFSLCLVQPSHRSQLEAPFKGRFPSCKYLSPKPGGRCCPIPVHDKRNCQKYYTA